jgi:hypothetical protein
MKKSSMKIPPALAKVLSPEMRKAMEGDRMEDYFALLEELPPTRQLAILEQMNLLLPQDEVFPDGSTQQDKADAFRKLNKIPGRFLDAFVLDDADEVEYALQEFSPEEREAILSQVEELLVEVGLFSEIEMDDEDEPGIPKPLNPSDVRWLRELPPQQMDAFWRSFETQPEEFTPAMQEAVVRRDMDEFLNGMLQLPFHAQFKLLTRLVEFRPEARESEEAQEFLRNARFIAALPPSLLDAMQTGDVERFAEEFAKLPPELQEQAASLVAENVHEDEDEFDDDEFDGEDDEDDEEAPEDTLERLAPVLQELAAAAHTKSKRDPARRLLEELEENGWPIGAAVRSIWAGERKLDRLSKGLDWRDMMVLEEILRYINKRQ